MPELKEYLPAAVKETTLSIGEKRKRAQEAKIIDECDQIKTYWANGIITSSIIKKKLNLNSQQYHNRLERIAQEEVEHRAFSWIMFLQKKQMRYQEVKTLKEKIEKTIFKILPDGTKVYHQPNYNVYLGCIRLMDDIDKEIIEIGQRLGMVHTDPSHTNSLEGMYKKWMEFLGTPTNGEKKNYTITNANLFSMKVSSDS